MTSALTDSMNQVSEEEKRRKRRAELQSKINQYKNRLDSRGFYVNRVNETPISPYQVETWQKEYDSLNY